MGVVYYNEIMISLSTGDTGTSCDIHILEPHLFNAMSCLKIVSYRASRVIDQSNELAQLINMIH